MGRSKQAVPRRLFTKQVDNDNGSSSSGSDHRGTTSDDSIATSGSTTRSSSSSSHSSKRSKRLSAKQDQLWSQDEEHDSDADNNSDSTSHCRRHDEQDLFLGRIPGLLRRRQQQQKSLDNETTTDTDAAAFGLLTNKKTKFHPKSINDNDSFLSLLFAAELVTPPPQEDEEEKNSQNDNDDRYNNNRASTEGSSGSRRLSRIRQEKDDDDDDDDDDAFLFGNNHNREPKQQQRKKQRSSLKRLVVMDDDDDDDDTVASLDEKKTSVTTTANHSSGNDLCEKSPCHGTRRRRVQFAVIDDDDDDQKDGKQSSRSNSSSRCRRDDDPSLGEGTKVAMQATTFASTVVTTTPETPPSETIRLVFACSKSLASSAAAAAAPLSSSLHSNNDKSTLRTMHHGGNSSISGSTSSHYDHDDDSKTDERIQCHYYSAPPPPNSSQRLQKRTSNMAVCKQGGEQMKQHPEDCFELLRIPLPSHVRIMVNNSSDNNNSNNNNMMMMEEKETSSPAATTTTTTATTRTADRSDPAPVPLVRNLPVTTVHNLWQLGRAIPSLEVLLKRQKTRGNSNSKERRAEVDNQNDEYNLALSCSSIIQCLGHGTLRVDLVRDNDDTDSTNSVNVCWFVRLAMVKKMALYHCHATRLPLLNRAVMHATKKYQPARQLHVALATIFADCALLQDTARAFATRSPTAAAATAPLASLSKKKKAAPKRKSSSKRSSTDYNMSVPLLRSEESKDCEYDDDDGKQAGNNVNIITAKQVYDLTDNCQLKRVLQQKPKASSSACCWTEKIQGILLPTLRPYQEAAVEWMLQRERQPQEQQQALQNNSDEWKLAWIVLKTQHCGHILPLFEYKQQQLQQDEEKENILLFCPFTGWLADSMQRAQSMMMTVAATATTTAAATSAPTATLEGLSQGQDEHHVVRGGILAEAMGLGKSVEVLACILANPRPPPLGDESSVAKRTTTATTVKRRLNFDEKHQDGKTEDTTSTETGNGVGSVGDLNDFGDADDDDESSLSSDKNTKTINGSIINEDHICIASLPQRLGTAEETGMAMEMTGVPVTPDDKSLAKDDNGTAKLKASTIDETEEDEVVRWVEDDEPLGSCICGNLIGLHELNKSPIVFCPDCEEPMHMECAAFASKDELESASSPLVYRRLFTNEKWTCRLLDHCHCCPCCVAERGQLILSRATVIVTPPAILSQWKREIQRHTQQHGPDGKPCLRVVVYEGIAQTAKSFGPRKQDVASRMELVHPHKLADSDIVLLTYDTLRADLGHANGNPYTADGTSALRKRKRYRVVPSPLTGIHWWRVCLDEAQRVESTTALSAQMAMKLESAYRWGITGTPVGRGKMEDLYGLLLFLRMEPFTWKLFFNKCFNAEYFGVGDRIQCLLENVFWRSTKDFELVREQMGVPEQIEVKVGLRFSSIEKHFYDRQLEQTLLTAGDIAERERSGKKRKRKELNLLAEHLHRLRAACCHPQVGSSGINKKQRPGARKKQRPGAKKAAAVAAKKVNVETEETNGVGSRVMTMDEILTRFIEDAKLKCEEAQRLAVMHTNAMAAISRLKVEARDRGIEIKDTDAQLLTQSCKLYLESLDMAEANARPTLVLGNGIMTGTTGFLSSQKSMKDGAAQVDWKLPGGSTSLSSTPPEVWARVDFEGPSRKLVQVRVRPIREIPILVLNETSDDFVWRLLHPKTVVFQVSSAAVGGEFVDLGEMTCPPPPPIPVEGGMDASEDSNDWVVDGGFRTNKSKSWRLVIKSYYNNANGDREEPSGQYVGLDVRLLEADIASDSLQRLHCLHNAALSFSSLLQIRENGNEDKDEALSMPNFSTSADLTQRLATMKKEAEKIESLYMDVARSLHQECHRRFEEWSNSRGKLEAELMELSRASPLSLSGNRPRLQDCWDDGWWDDFLVMCHLHGSEFHQRTLCQRVQDDLDRIQGGPERGLIRFPTFRDFNGLRVALSSRIQGIRSGIGKEAAWIGTHDEEPEHQTLYQFREDRFRCSRGMFAKCMQEISSFSPTPSDKEMFENSHCRVCKADWNQQGPTCRHCLVGNNLNELEPDRVTLCLLNSIYGVLRGPVGRTVCENDNGACIDERAKKFFDILESQKKEKVFAWRHWRTHLDLLNDLDELGQCKASMRLSLEDEDLTTLTDDQLNAIVVPIDLNTRYHDHAAKQAMALGDLRRAKDTLRYLRNQSAEQQQTRSRQEEEQCLVCYEPFDTDRAVLQCGHSFHFTPCLKKLQERAAIGGSICCPLRCRVRTHPSKVMIASEKRHDDGSRSKRNIHGSWGTKVTRLVSDLLDVQDVGDKAVLFSQWDDMLDIVQQALIANGIRHVRATSSKETGDFVNRFRAVDCTALLLNVKNGAEGLTIIEATHVFMVEPLMNHGLDLQAISRVCRIGQTKKTYVHRYIMQGTVEVKIDALRIEHQGEILEDALLEGKNTTIRAGGIDGGFRSETELLDLLHIPDEQEGATICAKEA